MILERRSFLTGIGATLIVAPAIVRPTSIMPIKTFREEGWVEISLKGDPMKRIFVKWIIQCSRETAKHLAEINKEYYNMTIIRNVKEIDASYRFREAQS